MLVLFHLGATGILTQIFAWLFVASRIVHAWVHTGSNCVPLRRASFLFGCGVVMAMLVLAFVVALTQTLFVPALQ